jgi:hypothetical protein
MGGPTICPACDCGNFGIERIKRQAKRIAELEAKNEALTAAISAAGLLKGGKGE